jgi:hypothetical protein
VEELFYQRRQEELTNRKRHKPPLATKTTNAIPEGNLDPFASFQNYRKSKRIHQTQQTDSQKGSPSASSDFK